MNTTIQTTLDGPKRIQRTRRKGSRLPVGAVCVSRPHRLGNVFKVEALPYPLFPQGSYAVTDLDNRSGFNRHVEERIFPDKFAATVVAVRSYELHVGPMGAYEYDQATWDYIRSLAGRDIACWCPLVDETGYPWPCHGNSILRWANGPLAAETPNRKEPS